MTTNRSILRAFSVLGLAMVSQFSSAVALADRGGGGTGGGDHYTVDFVATASQAVYPWLKAHGDTLKPKVNADDFLMATSPKDIASAEHVFESCDGSGTGREVEACFNADTGQIILSRSRYPIQDANSPDKLKLVAHEVFRKMHLEGDQYEISRQIPLFDKKVARAQNWECDAAITQGDFRFNSSTKGWTSEKAARDEIVHACIKNHFDPAVCQWGANSPSTFCSRKDAVAPSKPQRVAEDMEEDSAASNGWQSAQ